MVTPELLKQNQELLNSFLVGAQIPDEYKLPPHERIFGYIYCIENKLNGRKYIGAVYSGWMDVQDPDPSNLLRKRASNYIYEYNSARKTTSSAKKTFRPIIQALCDDGFENFTMYPIAETTKNNHVSAEIYFIEKLDTIDDGYNVYLGRGRNSHTGRKFLSKDKEVRSDKIIGVNLNKKEILFSDSMKLFADFIGTSKDMIKNVNRIGRSYKGWFIFYIDDEKRNHVLNMVVNGTIQHQTQHSERSKKFYSGVFSSISAFIHEYPHSEIFSDFTELSSLIYSDEIDDI